MLGLTGFIKKNLDTQGRLPDKWKDEAPSSYLVWDADSLTLHISAGVYSQEYNGVLYTVTVLEDSDCTPRRLYGVRYLVASVDGKYEYTRFDEGNLDMISGGWLSFGSVNAATLEFTQNPELKYTA